MTHLHNDVSKHIIRILDSTGDTEIKYDPADAREVGRVAERFNELMQRSFVAFDVTTQPGRVITAFDPAAEEIIISHRFAGG